jgi:hypothetical protein
MGHILTTLVYCCFESLNDRFVLSFVQEVLEIL